MSHKLLHTDRLQDHHNLEDKGTLSISTQQSMPPAEHQPSQRPIRLSDLNKYSKKKEERTAGCLGCTGGLFKKRRNIKGTKPTSVDDERMTHRPKTNSIPATEILASPRSEKSIASSVVSSRRLVATPTSATSHVPPRSREDVTRPSPTKPQPPSIPQHDYGNTPNQPLHIPRKPVVKYGKASGEVPKYAVQVSHPSNLRQSVHLTLTQSNDYQAKNDTKRNRKSSLVTNFGDLIRTLQDDSAEQPPLPLPPSTRQQSSDRSSHNQDLSRDPQPTFAIPDYNHASTPKDASNLRHSQTIVEDQPAKAEPQECNICGTPNSPCTRYADQGLWLCTACRSPTASIEFPPRKDSRSQPEARRKRLRSPKVTNRKNSSDELRGCQYCHTSLPPHQRNGDMFCSWCCKQLTENAVADKTVQKDSAGLVLLSARRYKSVASIATQAAEDEWEDFDSDNVHGNASITPPLPERSADREVKSNGKHSDRWQIPDEILKPLPPLKDSVYLSSRRFSPNSPTQLPPSPPKNDPPPPPTTKDSKSPSQTIEAPDRDSFYPDTPTPTATPKAPNFPPPPPPVPARPRQKQRRLRKKSSVSPLTPPKSSAYDYSAANFPYPPPPIPKDGYVGFRMQRSSSVYPDDPVPRLGTPDWQVNSPDRDTRFYEYWEAILGDVERRDTGSD